MIDPQNVPQVTPAELLGRYVLHSSHIRRSSGTLKPDAFMPHPHQELSVTRHLDATADELWAVGEAVALARGKTLYGRGDVETSVCLAQRLTVEAGPLPSNPNHANVRGWPPEKPAQKITALEIATAAAFVEKR